MKKTILNSLTVVTLFFASAANAQVGVGVPAGDIHPSAELEVKSTTKGFLPPRMTKAERDAILTPAAGLLIYQTDGDETNPTGLYFFDGTAWKNVAGVQGIKGDKGDQGPAGTGISSGTSKNQLMYWNGSAWVTLNPGTNGQVLTVSDGDLIWKLIEGYGKRIKDIDGNTYGTVNIGNQQWMVENLKVTKYNDGTAIPNITDNTQWSQLSTGAWSYYNNDLANNAKYGKLYNWYAVSKTSNGNKNVCPTGWHVPTDDEWTVLTEYLGGASVVGGKMKEVGTTSWNSPNTDAMNTSLFTGLPGGNRHFLGNYINFGNFGYWWSSTEASAYSAWNRFLNYNDGDAGRYIGSKEVGYSVRCLRD
jgi:uncharacterized protein (TIGR02145 family)